VNEATSSIAAASATRGGLYYRHALAVRIMHWINVVALTILLMSGLQIFNAHPALYWGKSSYTGRPALLEIGAKQGGESGAMGVTRVFGREFDTTGVLGLWRDGDGEFNARAFPGWITIPTLYSLAMARSWHFFFAWVLVINGLCYLVYTIWSRHLARDLAPTGAELGSIGQSIGDHLRFRHPTGEAAKRYNVLQKLAYLAVIFVLVPVIVLMGLAMSPRMDALYAGWVDLFGGRQSARTIHFIVAWLLVAFVLIHLFQVIVTGPWNNLRSMITGRYRVPRETPHE
jgi:thiosulfate reductase cytochrome b subunit